jgi:hypothetical protein
MESSNVLKVFSGTRRLCTSGLLRLLKGARLSPLAMSTKDGTGAAILLYQCTKIEITSHSNFDLYGKCARHIQSRAGSTPSNPHCGAGGGFLLNALPV